jgi:ABC-2 type transport system permease protein
LLLISIPFGLDVTPVGALVMIALVGLIGLGISSIAYSAALVLRNEDSYAPLIFTVSLPLLLLSGVLLPLSLAPKWLQTIAYLNPLSYAVKAARDVFNGQGTDADVFIGLAVILGLAIVGVIIGAQAFKRSAA